MIMSHDDWDIDSYEDYADTLLFLLTDEQQQRREQSIEDLKAAFPEYAARQKVEAEERRKSGRYERFQYLSLEKQLLELAEIDIESRYVVVRVNPNNDRVYVMHTHYAVYDRKQNSVREDLVNEDVQEVERRVEQMNKTESLWRKPGTPPLVLPKPKPKEVDFASEGYKTGDIITHRNERYRVTHDSFYISAKEAYDLEDGWDAYVSPGWHTTAVQIIEGEEKHV
jgi:hypothetical protein